MKKLDTVEEVEQFLQKQESSHKQLQNLPEELRRFTRPQSAKQQAESNATIYYLEVREVENNQAQLTLHWIRREAAGVAAGR